MCNNKYTYMYSISILCMEVYGIVLKYNIYIYNIVYCEYTELAQGQHNTFPATLTFACHGIVEGLHMFEKTCWWTCEIYMYT